MVIMYISFFFFFPALAGNSFSLCPWRCLTHNNHVFRTSQKCVRKLSRLFLPQAAREPVGIERRIERVLFAILLSRHLMSRARRRENTAPCPGFSLKQWESLIASGRVGFRNQLTGKREHRFWLFFFFLLLVHFCQAFVLRLFADFCFTRSFHVR